MNVHGFGGDGNSGGNGGGGRGGSGGGNKTIRSGNTQVITKKEPNKTKKQ